MHNRIAALALVVIVVLSGPGQAFADILKPSLVGAAVDSDNDGIGDRIDVRPLITNFPPSERFSTIFEFDISPFHLFSLTEGRLAGTIFTNNGQDTGPRTFDIQLFAGNGSLDAADFHVPGLSIGMVTYHPPGDITVDFSFDALGQLQSLVDTGANHIGVRVAAVNQIAPSAMSDQFLTLTIAGTPAVVPEPGSLCLLGLGMVLVAYRAWRSAAGRSGR